MTAETSRIESKLSGIEGRLSSIERRLAELELLEGRRRFDRMLRRQTMIIYAWAVVLGVIAVVIIRL